MLGPSSFEAAGEDLDVGGDDWAYRARSAPADETLWRPGPELDPTPCPTCSTRRSASCADAPASRSTADLDGTATTRTGCSRSPLDGRRRRRGRPARSTRCTPWLKIVHKTFAVAALISILILGAARLDASAATPSSRSRTSSRRRTPSAPATSTPRADVRSTAPDVERLRRRDERDARPAADRVRQAGADRGPAAPVRVRRFARAAHPAGRDPRPRRAVPRADGAPRPSRSTRRCATSRPRACACSRSSRTSCCSPGSTRAAPLARDAVDVAAVVDEAVSGDPHRRRRPRVRRRRRAGRR